MKHHPENLVKWLYIKAQYPYASTYSYVCVLNYPVSTEKS